MKNDVLKEASKAMLSLTLKVASASVVQGCWWTAHQPKEPKALANSMMQKEK